MDSIKRQDDHDDEIGNQHSCIERIPPVESVEVINSVRIMRIPIVAKAFGSKKQRKESRRYLKERGQFDAPAKVRINRFYAIRCSIRLTSLLLLIRDTSEKLI